MDEPINLLFGNRPDTIKLETLQVLTDVQVLQDIGKKWDIVSFYFISLASDLSQKFYTCIGFLECTDKHV